MSKFLKQEIEKLVRRHPLYIQLKMELERVCDQRSCTLDLLKREQDSGRDLLNKYSHVSKMNISLQQEVDYLKKECIQVQSIIDKNGGIWQRLKNQELENELLIKKVKAFRDKSIILVTLWVFTVFGSLWFLHGIQAC